jgi:hypothetical protein
MYVNHILYLNSFEINNKIKQPFIKQDDFTFYS